MTDKATSPRLHQAARAAARGHAEASDPTQSQVPPAFHRRVAVQHRLIQIAAQAAPLTIALNASAIYLAVSASGLIGAAGIRLLGAHRLGLISAVLILAGLTAAQSAHALIARPKGTARED